MSKATKRKHVEKEVMDEFVLPEGTQKVVKVVASRGNNLHEVETEHAEKFLVSMPTKFRKNVWIKRGDFVIVTMIEEGEKVKAEIINILYKEQIKYIKEEGKWPAAFCDTHESVACEGSIPCDMLPPSDTDSDSDTEHLGDMVINTNRPANTYVETSSEEEDDDDDD